MRRVTFDKCKKSQLLILRCYLDFFFLMCKYLSLLQNSDKIMYKV